MILRSLLTPLIWLCVAIGTAIFGAIYSIVFFAGCLRDQYEKVKR